MKKTLYNMLICLVLIHIFTSCSKESDTIGKPSSYFVKVTQSKDYSIEELKQTIGPHSAGEFLTGPAANFTLRVQIDAIHYRTKDPGGKPITASGIISFPRSGNFKGVILAEHYTITDEKEAPSEVMYSLESIYSFMDYVVITPDYIGLGETKNLPHPYLHTESAGQVSIDMLFAAREYMESMQKPIPKEIYIVGYSEGGASALACQKITEQRYASEIPIKHVMAGGGPYDLVASCDHFIKQNESAYPCSIPLLVIGLNYGDNLQLDFTRIFHGKLLEDYPEWFGSKKYSSFKINKFMNTQTISEFMHHDMFLPEMNPDFRKLYASFKKNSLVNWKPKNPLLLVHGKTDTYVPFLNAQTAYDSFKAKGCPVELCTTEHGHLATVPYFYYKVTEILLANK